MTNDIDLVCRWAKAHGLTLRFTCHPDGIWDLTVKPGRDADHEHFTAESLATAIAQLMTDYGVADSGFSQAGIR